MVSTFVLFSTLTVRHVSELMNSAMSPEWPEEGYQREEPHKLNVCYGNETSYAQKDYKTGSRLTYTCTHSTTGDLISTQSSHSLILLCYICSLFWSKFLLFRLCRISKAALKWDKKWSLSDSSLLQLHSFGMDVCFASFPGVPHLQC